MNIHEGERSKKLARATDPAKKAKLAASQKRGMSKRALRGGKGGEKALNWMFGIKEAVEEALINLIIQKNIDYYLNEGGGDLDIMAAEEEESDKKKAEEDDDEENTINASRQATARAEFLNKLKRKRLNKQK